MVKSNWSTKTMNKCKSLIPDLTQKPYQRSISDLSNNTVKNFYWWSKDSRLLNLWNSSTNYIFNNT